MDRKLYFYLGDKSFELFSSNRGLVRWFVLTESSRQFNSSIKIDDCNLHWVCEALHQASLGTGNKCRSWERKIQTYTFRVIQNFNRYRRFVRIEAILGDKKSAVIILEGSYNGGWSNIATKIQGFLGKGINSRFSLFTDQSRSYLDAAKIPQWPIDARFNTSEGEGGSNPKELDNEHFLSKCLIGRFNDPFHHSPKPEIIQKWFVSRWQVTVGLKVTPINHNLFLVDLPSRQEVKRVKCGEWFWNGRKLTLEWWSPVSRTKTRDPIPEHKWVKALGIPLHAWSSETFKFIGDKCGGFIDTDEDAKHRTHFYWARICIRNSMNELPAKIDIFRENWVFKILIYEDNHATIRSIQKSIGGKDVKQRQHQPSDVAKISTFSKSSIDTSQRNAGCQGNNFNLNIGLPNCLLNKNRAAAPRGNNEHLDQVLDKTFYKKGPFRKAQNESKLLKEKSIWKVVGHKPNPYHNRSNALSIPSMVSEEDEPQTSMVSAPVITKLEANDEADSQEGKPNYFAIQLRI
ncbi:hypothetical protein P3L10_020446 [Capsicum annuum]